MSVCRVQRREVVEDVSREERKAGRCARWVVDKFVRVSIIMSVSLKF